MLILVTGTPGVGKTRFAKKLSKGLDLKYISLDDIIIENQLYISYNKDRGSYIVDIDRAKRFVFENVKLEDCVVDSHIALNIIPCELVDLCIVLRCDPYILLERLLSKGFSREKAIENAQAEIIDIILSEALALCVKDKVVEIDVSRGVDDIVEEVIKVLKADGKIKSFPVNWLKYILERDELDFFFPKEASSSYK